MTSSRRRKPANNKRPQRKPAAPLKPVVAPRQQPQPVDQLSFRHFLQVLSRRKAIIISTVVLLTGMAAIVLSMLPARYAAEALVRIEPDSTNVVALKSVIAGLRADDETIQSEIQVLTSRDLAKKVVAKLHLDQNPEFNDALRARGFVSKYLDPRQWVPTSWLGSSNAKADDEAPSDGERKTQQEDKIVSNFIDSLNITAKIRTHVISVVATSKDPKLASVIADTLANLYIANQVEVHLNATKRASQGLNEQIAQLRKAVDQSEKAVEAYRQKAGLISANNGVTLQEGQLSQVNTQLIVADADANAKAAKLAQVQSLIKTNKVDTLGEVLNSPLIQKLREQETQVQRKIAELSSEYGNLHPKMINARAEEKDLENKIQLEISKIVSGMQNDVVVAKAKENALQKSVKELENQVAEANNTSIKLRALEREASANRTLLKTFLDRVKETTAQENTDIQQPDARIISFAGIPDKPSFPKTKLILAITLVGSFFTGVLLAFIVEQLTKGFRSGEEIESETGMSVLGLVPRVDTTWKRPLSVRLKLKIASLGSRRLAMMLGLTPWLRGLAGKAYEPASYIVDKPTSAFGESVRGIITSILLTQTGDKPLKVLFTSAQPNEGKTTLSVCMARLLAMSGYKVALVEADLRLSVVYKRMDLPNEPGLAEFLSGEASLEDVMKTDEKTGAHIITAGKPKTRPLDLLTSDDMKELLDHLAEEHDFIIIDSPPTMAVSDARVLSVMADMTVFAVRWTSTARKVVKMALRQMANGGGTVAGVVLTMVDAREHAKYDYGDSGYYFEPMMKYYAD